MKGKVATCKVEIRVMQKHIQEGRRHGREDCPIAIAINAALKPVQLDTFEGFSVSVWYDGTAHLLGGFGERARPPSRKGIYRQIKLPQSAREFILAFDQGHPVQPFSFSLRLPGWALGSLPKGE